MTMYTDTIAMYNVATLNNLLFNLLIVSHLLTWR